MSLSFISLIEYFIVSPKEVFASGSEIFGNNPGRRDDTNNGDPMLISIIRTIILYIFIITAIRLMGKRQISDMQPSELVVTMVISDIASLPMQNTSQPLLSGVVPVLVLVALEITVSAVMLKSQVFRRLVCGRPVVVISDGELQQKEMRRLRLTTEDLCAQLRAQGVFRLEDAQYCIVETNGTVSVLEKPEKRTPEVAQLGIKGEKDSLETVAVSDGKLLEDALKLCGKKKADVDNILKSNNTEIGEVFILTLDAQGKYSLIKKEKEE